MNSLRAKGYFKKIAGWIGWCAVVYLVILSLYIVNNFIWHQRLLDLDKIYTKASERELEYRMPSLALLKRQQHRELDDLSREKITRWLDVFREKEDSTPFLADCYGWQGYCHYLLGQTSKAAAAYQKAVQLEPFYFWSHHHLGVVYYSDHQYKLAANSFFNALKTHPLYSLTIMRKFITADRPVILHRAPPMSFLMRTFRMNSLLRKGYGDCYRYLMVSLFRLEDYGTILEECRTAIQIKDTPKHFLYVMAGMAAAEMEKFELALDLLKKGITEYKKDPVVMRYLAETLAGLGELEQGQAVMTKAEQFEAEGRSDIFSSTVPKMILF